jgi:hypothetical protein
MNDVHIISENELQRVKKFGRRFRACCPVHNSRDRDLSIAPYSDDYLTDEERDGAGFGYCHGSSCHAVVLVQEWNPQAAARLSGKSIRTAPPRLRMTGEELDQAEEWQRRELAALNKIYENAAGNLRHLRAYAYLAGRGLGSSEALDLLAQTGAAYISPADEWKRKPPFELARWCDRIIFPFLTRDAGRGFIGRTLLLWLPGMDEREHKRLLDEHDRQAEEEHGKDAGRYQIRRWLKTYRSGFFNGQVMSEHRRIHITEGAFDAIPLLLAGLSNTVAVAGTHFDIQAIPKKVLDITLAFDADTQGKAATERTLDTLAGAGIEATFCAPPDDGQGKDWSERYRRAGLAGLAILLEQIPAYQGGQNVTPELVTDNDGPACELEGDCVECGAPVEYYSDNGKPYCAAHWPGDTSAADDTPCVQDWLEPAKVENGQLEEAAALWHEIGQDIHKRKAEELAQRCRDELSGWRVSVELVGSHRKAQALPLPTTPAEYWQRLSARLPARFYERLSALPDPRFFEHYPGGYAGYCQRYARKGT